MLNEVNERTSGKGSRLKVFAATTRITDWASRMANAVL
jgi:hypothetical protein